MKGHGLETTIHPHRCTAWLGCFADGSRPRGGNLGTASFRRNTRLGYSCFSRWGLAAPLFVALLGWGLLQRQLSGKQRVWRAGWLFACQLVVNLSAPHLFEPWTPGVLSLMGILILTEKWWGQWWRRSSTPQRTFGAVAVLVLLFITLFETWQGPSNWESRVASESATEWIGHLMLTGLYPFIPWAIFAALGMTIASLRGEDEPFCTERFPVLDSWCHWLCLLMPCGIRRRGLCRRETPP